MNLRRYWPGYALLVAALMGAIAGGTGGAVVVATLALLAIGPSYLVQKRLQRRNGIAPSGRGLDRGADEAMTALVTGYLLALNRSPRVRAAVYVGGVALVALMWLIAGPGWALAPVGWAVVLTVVAAARRRS
jgi:hypothetical protein